MKYLFYISLIFFSLYIGYKLDHLQNGKTVILAGKTCGRTAEQLKNYPDYICSAEYRAYGEPLVVKTKYKILTENSPSVTAKFGNTIATSRWQIAAIGRYEVSYNAAALFSTFIVMTWLLTMAHRQTDDPLLKR